MKMKVLYFILVEFKNLQHQGNSILFIITLIYLQLQLCNLSFNRRLSNDRTAKSYVRPQQPQLISNEIQNETIEKQTNVNDDEIKKLRFPHHRTAFDINLDDLDASETPWRSKLVPVSLICNN